MSLFLRAIGIMGIAGLAGVSAGASFLSAGDDGVEIGAKQRNVSGVFAPLPVINAEAPNLILGMSPFARDRSAFDRATASAPPPPPVDVRLTGVFRVGKELRASLTINGQSLVVSKGDETAAGTVQAIEVGAVVLSGATEQRLEMFK